jgi:hypothetical protein
MHRTTLILLGIASLTSLGVAPAEAARRQYPYCMQGAKSPGLSNCYFHQPGAVPGHGIGQAYDVHQKPVLRTAGPPFDVVSGSAANKGVKPASGHRLQASAILDAPRTTLGNPRSAATP